MLNKDLKDWMCDRGEYVHGGATDIETRLTGMRRGEERARCIERVTWKLTLPYVK